MAPQADSGLLGRHISFTSRNFRAGRSQRGDLEDLEINFLIPEKLQVSKTLSPGVHGGDSRPGQGWAEIAGSLGVGL